MEAKQPEEQSSEQPLDPTRTKYDDPALAHRRSHAASLKQQCLTDAQRIERFRESTRKHRAAQKKAAAERSKRRSETREITGA